MAEEILTAYDDFKDYLKELVDNQLSTLQLYHNSDITKENA